MDIRITVVEDEEHFAKHLVRCLEEWSRKAEWNVKIEQYGGAEPLLVRLDSDMLDDVYILDVEMPYMNGIQLAQCIRRKDPDAYIVFLTAHEEWALQGYDVQACGYVLKEKYSDKLQRILQEIIEKLKWEEKDVYAICSDRKWKKIRQSEITYLEKNGKNTVFHCRKKMDYRERKSLQDVVKVLSPEHFVPISRGQVVNLGQVQSMDGGMLFVSSGEKLDVSRYLLEDVRKKLMLYYRKLE